MTQTRERTLALANRLIDAGVPVIVCRPKRSGTEVIPMRAWRGVTDASQCRKDLDQFRFGTDALALIGGFGIDLVDLDTKAGGTVAPLGKFEYFGLTRTPSGGLHYVVPSCGLRKISPLQVNGQLVGDYIGGNGDGSGKMLAFLPGSVRPKYGDVMYVEEEEWQVEEATLLATPDVGLVELLRLAGKQARKDLDEAAGDDGPERAPEDGLHPYCAAGLVAELQRLDALDQPWHSGAGWDTTCFEVACNLVRFANSAWTGLDEDTAREMFLARAPADDVWGTAEARAKWRGAVRTVDGAVRPSPGSGDFTAWAGAVGGSAGGTGGTGGGSNGAAGGAGAVAPDVDVSNSADALVWLKGEVGRAGRPLAGVFRRGRDLVHTPQIGEDGYVPPPDGKDEDGPAQVQVLRPGSLAAQVDDKYNVFKMTRATRTTPPQPTAALFPKTVSERLLDGAGMTGCAVLRSVTHTPTLRADGSVLDTPGFDTGTGTLYLPTRGLHVPVPEKPTVEEMNGARELLLSVVVGFPWNTVHDQANYLAAMLAPLVREVIAAPAPLVLVNAHQRGSGKSLLATVLRTLHGGVFRASVPTTPEEWEKSLTTILDQTTAPVVVFDNLATVLQAAALDALLTSRDWTARRLGGNEQITTINDRLWVVTGNNIRLGGDLTRRVLWASIDPKMPNPHLRTNFAIRNLEAWVTEHRGELLAALLTLLRGWHCAGRPMPVLDRSDSFASWFQVMHGVLEFAGAPGVVGHADTVAEVETEDDHDLAAFLREALAEFGPAPFGVAEILEAGLTLPDYLRDTRGFGVNPRRAGRWLSGINGQWADGLALRRIKDRNNAAAYAVMSAAETA